MKRRGNAKDEENRDELEHARQSDASQQATVGWQRVDLLEFLWLLA